MTAILSWTFLPGLLAWGLGIVLAAKMLRRGGGKAEKLLLAGCCILVISTVYYAIYLIALPQLVTADPNRISQSVMYSVYKIPIQILNLAGAIFLLLAFWHGFIKKNREVSE